LQKKKEEVAKNLFLGERQKQNGFCIKKWAYEVAEQCKEIFFNKNDAVIRHQIVGYLFVPAVHPILFR